MLRNKHWIIKKGPHRTGRPRGCHLKYSVVRSEGISTERGKTGCCRKASGALAGVDVGWTLSDTSRNRNTVRHRCLTCSILQAGVEPHVAETAGLRCGLYWWIVLT